MNLVFADRPSQRTWSCLVLFLQMLFSACSVYDADIIMNTGQDSAPHDGSYSNQQSDGSLVSDSRSTVESSVDGDAVQRVDDAEEPLLECRPTSDPNCPLICPEVCDDQDNDCNNEIDDGDLWIEKGAACGVGIGECAVVGRYICDETNPEGRLICNVTPSDPSDEICDGRDNNCDGETDETFPDSDDDGVADCANDDDDDDGIDNMSDNCPLESNPDQEDFDEDGKGDACDTDDDNDSDPDTSDCAPLDPEIHNGATEICDELDNDCNDDIDDGIYCGIPFSYDPSNFHPDDVDPGSAPQSVSLDCDAIFDSSDPPTFFEWCGQPTPDVTVDSSGSTQVVILTLRDFTLTETGSLTLIGARPVVLVIFGDANIDGELDASARLTEPGPGGNLLCDRGKGGDGEGTDSDNDGSGGGGGGAFGDIGGDGAKGDLVDGGSNGVVEGNPELVPLRGGCPGGSGGRGDGSIRSSRFGGGGGGGVQISATGTLSITGVISAGGGGGQVGDGVCDGGGGGGSGGAVLLEANTVQISIGAWVTANGGGGAEGIAEGSDPSGNNGQNGLSASGENAFGGKGGGDGGDGGNGGSAVDPTGDNGSEGHTSDDGSGGGGGGVGRVRVNAFDSCAIDGTISASTSYNGC